MEVFSLAALRDGSGTLLVDDLVARGLPAVRRVGFIYDVPRDGSRGGHAHKEQSEIVICVCGGVDLRVEARGAVSTIALRAPGRALRLPPATWRDLIDFEPGTIVALLSSDVYDETDYIRDHAEFLAWEARSA